MGVTRVCTSWPGPLLKPCSKTAQTAHFCWQGAQQCSILWRQEGADCDEYLGKVSEASFSLHNALLCVQELLIPIGQVLSMLQQVLVQLGNVLHRVDTNGRIGYGS